MIAKDSVVRQRPAVAGLFSYIAREDANGEEDIDHGYPTLKGTLCPLSLNVLRAASTRLGISASDPKRTLN